MALRDLGMDDSGKLMEAGIYIGFDLRPVILIGPELGDYLCFAAGGPVVGVRIDLVLREASREAFSFVSFRNSSLTEALKGTMSSLKVAVQCKVQILVRKDSSSLCFEGHGGWIESTGEGGDPGGHCSSRSLSR